MSTREVPLTELRYGDDTGPYVQALGIMENRLPYYVGALMSLTQAQVRQVIKQVLREVPG